MTVVIRADAVMTKPVVTITADDRLRKVSRIFREKKLHHLLVVDGKEFVGIVSDRDFFRSIGPRAELPVATEAEAASLNKRVHQVMSRHPICVRENQSVDDVMDLFIKHEISCVPVIDVEGFPIGIISWRDIIKLLHSRSKTSPSST
jgi:acetoin utilization protein AcuB